MRLHSDQVQVHSPSVCVLPASDCLNTPSFCRPTRVLFSQSLKVVLSVKEVKEITAFRAVLKLRF